MVEQNNNFSHDGLSEFKYKVKWLYLGRIVTITPCLTVYLLIAYLGKFLPDIRWLLAVCVFEIFVNIPYPFIVKIFYNLKKENALILYMLTSDIIATTIAMHVVGVQDGFFFGAIYLVTITFAGILTTKRITYIIVTLAAIFYGGLCLLEFNGIIPHVSTIGIKFTGIQMTGWAVSHILFFYIIAYLSNFFTKPIKRHEEELSWWSENLEKRLSRSHIETISALVRALKIKDPYMEVHSSNVAWYSALMAKKIDLPQDMIEDIKDACYLHDIGKIGISDNILNKNGKLTEEEMERIKLHPEFGSEIIAALSGTEDMAKMIIEEHEHFDGTGYPKGLIRDEICLGAQIIAIADAFDVLVSRRSYKEPYTPEKAVEIITSERGKQFNPEIVDLFLKVYEENKEDILRFVEKSPH